MGTRLGSITLSGRNKMKQPWDNQPITKHLSKPIQRIPITLHQTNSTVSISPAGLKKDCLDFAAARPSAQPKLVEPGWAHAPTQLKRQDWKEDWPWASQQPGCGPRMADKAPSNLGAMPLALPYRLIDSRQGMQWQ